MREIDGVIVKNEKELVNEIRLILKNPDAFKEAIEAVKEKYVFKMGTSSEYLAKCMETILEGNELPEWQVYIK